MYLGRTDVRTDGQTDVRTDVRTDPNYRKASLLTTCLKLTHKLLIDIKRFYVNCTLLFQESS